MKNELQNKLSMFAENWQAIKKEFKYSETFSLLLTWMNQVRHLAADSLTLNHFDRNTVLEFLDWLQNERQCTQAKTVN